MRHGGERARSITAFAVLLTSLLLLVAAPAAAESAPVADEYFGHVIKEVTVEGVPWANDLRSRIRGAVRVKDPLTRSGLQRAVRLLQTSSNRNRRLSRISSYAEFTDDRSVRVRFEVEPLRKVASVRFVHPPRLDENALLRAANIPVGSEFWPDTVADCARRIAAMYYRAGWRDARIGWEAQQDPSTGDVALFFEVLEGRPTTLVQLEFEGDTGLSDAAMQAAFDLQGGGTLSLDLIEEGLSDLRARYRTQQFYRARVGQPRIEAADQRAVLIVPVSAGPQFQLQVRGNRSIPQRVLLDRLRYTGEDPLDPPTERELAERMREYYESAGFPEATVVVREAVMPQPAEEGAARYERRLVTFIVREGKPIRVTDLEFNGLQFLKPRRAELVRRVQLVLEDSAPLELVRGKGNTRGDVSEPIVQIIPTEVFSRRLYKEACDQLTKLYKSEGFLDAKVGPATLQQLGDSRARVVIPIEEGPRTYISSVQIVKKKQVDLAVNDPEDEDADYLPDEEVSAVVRVKTGDPVSFLAIEDARNEIVQLYKAKGHLFVEVDDREEENDVDADRSEMKVTFIVKAGKAVHVANVDIRGTARTDQNLVREALVLKDGDLITPQALQQSVRNLLRLGIFTAAAVDIAEPERAETPKTLVVQLREKPAYTFEIKGGASLVDGPRVAAQFVRANLLGRNVSLTLSAKLNYPFFRYNGLFVSQGCSDCNAPPKDPIERNLSVALGWPIYRGGDNLPIDQRFDFVHENKNRPAYSLRRWASGVSFDGFWRARVGPFDLSSVFQADIENDLFNRLNGGTTSFADQRTLRQFPEGEISLISLRPGINIDARDDRLNPTKGLFANISLDYSQSILGRSDIRFLRGLGVVNGFIPVYRPRRIVIAIGGRIGAILSRGSQYVVGTKRFFLGGTSTLRGFNEDALVPEDDRNTLHTAIDRCRALVSGLGCGVQENGKPLAPDLVAIMNGTGTSMGGVFIVATRSELRFALTETLDAGLFFDAGNLWRELANVDLTKLRYATGAGLRFPLPIGPAAFDAGFNLHPDSLLNEPNFRIHLSIGAF
jgi:outer membrane protein assembly factor BamA